MYIGIPKESRPFEYRVGLSPAGVEILTHYGHQVFVEHEAGMAAGFSDQEYERAGARIAFSAEEVFGRADLLLKIARPLKAGIGMAAGRFHPCGIFASRFQFTGPDRPAVGKEDHSAGV
jgi:alanine dehydrogenase